MERDADRTSELPDEGSLAAQARTATLRLVADVGRVGPLVHGRGVVGRPVPVRAPAPPTSSGPSGSSGGPVAGVSTWFVPVTTGDRLAGFALVDVETTAPPADRADAREPAARIRRWSTFQRHEGDLESCPPALLWTDPPTITATAVAAVGAPDGVVTGEPTLTWERTPEHLVWEVTVGGRSVHVAGSSAWPA